MKIRKLCHALMALGLSSGAAQAAIQMNLEAPLPGDIDSGILNVMGWAVEDEPGLTIRSVAMQIDDQAPERIAYGAERNDVASAFPDIEEALHSGFAATINTRKLGNGDHRLTIVVTNDEGETRRLTHLFYVSNPPQDDQASWWDQIDLEGATARISGQRIFLDNVTVNGQTYDNVALALDKRTSGFQLVDWVYDRDGDGYKDDDADHDGYHDNDLDRDGFPDDDLDKDGLHDEDECVLPEGEEAVEGELRCQDEETLPGSQDSDDDSDRGGSDEDHGLSDEDHGADDEDHGPEGDDHGMDPEDLRPDDEDHGQDSEDHGLDGDDHGMDPEDLRPDDEDHGQDSEDHGLDGDDHGMDPEDLRPDDEDHGQDSEDHGLDGDDHGMDPDDLPMPPDGQDSDQESEDEDGVETDSDGDQDREQDLDQVRDQEQEQDQEDDGEEQLLDGDEDHEEQSDGDRHPPSFDWPH